MNDRQAWEKRWNEGQTRFHETAPNALLVAHADVLRGRVLVPLCGKSFDMRWLAERGHEVVGVEFVESAVKEHGEIPGVTIVVADMLTVGGLGMFDSVYDRAALVALAPDLRAEYIRRCRAMLKDDGVTLLVSLAYDQALVNGPPWSVSDVEGLYAPDVVTRLSRQDAEPTPRMRAAGIVSLEESVYLINRTPAVPENAPRGPNG